MKIKELKIGSLYSICENTGAGLWLGNHRLPPSVKIQDKDIILYIGPEATPMANVCFRLLAPDGRTYTVSRYFMENMLVSIDLPIS